MPSIPTNNLVWHHATVTRARREARNKHRGAILWFTGLSGSGKSTLAHAVEESLFQRRCHTVVLDGDNVRHGLCGDLGFSVTDRHENIRRIPVNEEELKKAAPIYFSYLETEAKGKGWAVYNYLMQRTNLPEEQQAISIKYCIDKDLPAFRATLHNYQMRLQVTMMREKFQEMKAIPPEAELFVRYQATLDNSLSKAIKGLREAQALRLSMIESVPLDA
jgi:hypothetical protein